MVVGKNTSFHNFVCTVKLSSPDMSCITLESNQPNYEFLSIIIITRHNIVIGY